MNSQPPPSAREFDPGIERDRVQSVLFQAVAELAQANDTGAVLQGVCDRLVDASPNILTAWVYLLGPPGGQVKLCEVHAAGARRSAIRRARSLPVLMRAVTPGGLHEDEQLMCFPLGEGVTVSGGIGVRVRPQNYLDVIGTDPLGHFAIVAGALLRQAQLRAHLRQLADYDELTGLMNRAAVQAALDHVHAQAERRGAPYALILLDVDHFKAINDNHGHAAGDLVLSWCAQSLRAVLRDQDWVGRWGGEEFLIVLPDAEAGEALQVANRVGAQISGQPFALEDGRLQVTVSGGVASYPLDGINPGELLSLADAALYAAKDGGRNRVQRPTFDGRHRHTMAARIEDGLREDRFRPALQPIVDLRTTTLVGYEVLARLIDPVTRKPEPAGSFIDVANQRHLVHHIDHRMFLAALEHLRRDVQAHGQPCMCFVNVSAALLRRPALIADLIEHVREHLTGMGTDTLPLVLEITERDFVDSVQARELLQPFIDLGVRLALDDFGSGYGSFRYLADLPISFLKIEGTLVRDAIEDAKCRAVVQGIRDIASELGLITLAEGIETREAAMLMNELGIDLGQGFCLGRPEVQQGCVA